MKMRELILLCVVVHSAAFVTKGYAITQAEDQVSYARNLLKRNQLVPEVAAKFKEFTDSYPDWFKDGRLSFSAMEILKKDPAFKTKLAERARKFKAPNPEDVLRSSTGRCDVLGRLAD